MYSSLSKTILNAAKSVIEQEITALQQTLDRVVGSKGDDFVRAANLIHNATFCAEGKCCGRATAAGAISPEVTTGGGRLVVTGLGKSGNVAAKVSATCSSLGIHSFYLHATEAAHGSLGCITSRDVVLLFSNSGRTEELLDIITSIKLIGCKTILVSSNSKSALAEIVDITISYGDIKEADPHSLAPTCSTIAAMAVGDALAVSISCVRGFSVWDFGKRHPGGILGQEVLGATFAHLQEHKQTHLLDHFNTLSTREKQLLHNDILDIDMPRLQVLAEEAVIPKRVDLTTLKPFPDVVKANDLESEDRDGYFEEGLQMIARGEVAAVVMAGGQATRAGITYPKGFLDVNLPSHQSLFEIQAKRLLKLQEIASQHLGKEVPQIPFYLMVSAASHKTVLDFFEVNNYYGMSPENVVLFDQGTLPCLTLGGKLLLEEKSKVARAPDGHGGLYEALHKNNITKHMKSRRIKSVFVYSVDNLLVKIAEPTFMGFCKSRNCDFGYKVVNKAYPAEPAGVVCLLDGKPDYVEYSELPSHIAELRNPNNGDLLYNAANILNLYYKLSFLDEIATNHTSLKYHVALKKVPFVNPAGELIIPEKPNAYKFEKFVLDCTPMAPNVQVFMVDRDSDFSPIKNRWGEKLDSPDSARVMLSELHKHYIEQAGGIVIGDAKTEMCEISPQVSYSGEGLAFVKGKTFTLPLFLSPQVSPDV